jgi:hypothetical protein
MLFIPESCGETAIAATHDTPATAPCVHHALLAATTLEKRANSAPDIGFMPQLFAIAAQTLATSEHAALATK